MSPLRYSDVKRQVARSFQTSPRSFVPKAQWFGPLRTRVRQETQDLVLRDVLACGHVLVADGPSTKAARSCPDCGALGAMT